MATSLMDDYDAELNRLRVVIDNDISDDATVIRVENLSRLWDLICAIDEHGLLIHDSDLHYHSSRLWHVSLTITGKKIAVELATSDIQTAIEESVRHQLRAFLHRKRMAIEEREHRLLSRMNAPPLELDESYFYMLDPWNFDHAAPITRQCDLPNITASLRDVFKKTGLNIFDAQSHDPAEPIMERRENPLVLPDSKWGFSKYAQFSCSPSRMSGIDLMVGSRSVHLPKHSSVHHPVIQMVLFATVSSDGSDRTYFAVPKATLTIKKKSRFHVAKKLHSGGVTLSKHSNVNEVMLSYTKTSHLRVSEQTSLNSSRYSEERRGSKMYALVIPRSPMSRDVGNMVPCLWLDSGASSHMVGDSTILINLRDVPIGRFITTADCSRLAVAKVGDIQTPDIRIQDVLYVHGLQMNLVSVRQLAKSKVVTTFYENHAELWSEGEQIGGAVVDDTVSLYKLRYLH